MAAPKSSFSSTSAHHHLFNDDLRPQKRVCRPLPFLNDSMLASAYPRSYKAMASKLNLTISTTDLCPRPSAVPEASDASSTSSTSSDCTTASLRSASIIKASNINDITSVATSKSCPESSTSSSASSSSSTTTTVAYNSSPVAQIDGSNRGSPLKRCGDQISTTLSEKLYINASFQTTPPPQPAVMARPIKKATAPKPLPLLKINTSVGRDGSRSSMALPPPIQTLRIRTSPPPTTAITTANIGPLTINTNIRPSFAPCPSPRPMAIPNSPSSTTNSSSSSPRSPKFDVPTLIVTPPSPTEDVKQIEATTTATTTNDSSIKSFASAMKLGAWPRPATSLKLLLFDHVGSQFLSPWDMRGRMTRQQAFVTSSAVVSPSGGFDSPPPTSDASNMFHNQYHSAFI
ncbi:hypothetical protein H4219_004292 [Mycoemilia scoparia]|uniref:Uncharacterized protein n=1 Tax=Mycoemilia scoparia TaxID=417184 RepID=A0A9W8DRE3_9FUNG|nr:hypothetical protein H4219_004292 [Mycoemilia scoparia]